MMEYCTEERVNKYGCMNHTQYCAKIARQKKEQLSNSKYTAVNPAKESRISSIRTRDGGRRGWKGCPECLLHESSLVKIHRAVPLVSVSFMLSSVAQLCPTLCDCSTPGSLSITNSRSLPKLMSIELVMPSNHLILCHPFLLLPSIFPSIGVFSDESALCIRWPKYWSFSIIRSNGHS